MKRCMRLLCAVSLTLFCTGCWDATEVDQLSIVTMSGVDLGPNGKSVSGSLQIARPSELGTTGGGGSSTATGSPQAYVVETADGPTASDTLNTLRHRLSRRVFMGHRRVIVIGEDYARKGVGGLIDEIIRNPNSRLRTYLVVAYHKQALDVLKTPYPLDRLPSDAIVELEEQGSTVKIDAKEFIEHYGGNGDPVTLGISIRPNPTQGATTDSAFALDRIAVFRRDKMVGWLTNEQTRGFLWVDGSIKSVIATVQVPGHPGAISARSNIIRSRHQIVFRQGRPYLDIKLQTQFDVTQNNSNLNLEDPVNVLKLQSALRREVQSEMESTMNALQHRYRADAFDFGDAFNERYPGEWRQVRSHWRATYSSMPVIYNLKVRLRDSGLISSSLSPS